MSEVKVSILFRYIMQKIRFRNAWTVLQTDVERMAGNPRDDKSTDNSLSIAKRFEV